MDTNKMRDIVREQFEATWADVMRGDEPPPGRKPTRSRIDPEKYAGDAAQFDLTPAMIPGGGYLEDQNAIAAIEAQGLRVAP